MSSMSAYEATTKLARKTPTLVQQNLIEYLNLVLHHVSRLNSKSRAS